MEVVAFVGPSGTGKSHRALAVAHEHKSEAIIDDAKQPDGHKFYKITVKNWSAFGEFGREHGDKYALEWNGGVQ